MFVNEKGNFMTSDEVIEFFKRFRDMPVGSEKNAVWEHFDASEKEIYKDWLSDWRCQKGPIAKTVVKSAVGIGLLATGPIGWLTLAVLYGADKISKSKKDNK